MELQEKEDGEVYKKADKRNLHMLINSRLEVIQS